MDAYNVDSAFEELLERIDENRIKQAKKGGMARGAHPTGHHLGKGAQFGTLEDRQDGGCGC